MHKRDGFRKMDLTHFDVVLKILSLINKAHAIRSNLLGKCSFFELTNFHVVLIGHELVDFVCCTHHFELYCDFARLFIV